MPALESPTIALERNRSANYRGPQIFISFNMDHRKVSKVTGSATLRGAVNFGLLLLAGKVTASQRRVLFSKWAGVERNQLRSIN